MNVALRIYSSVLIALSLSGPARLAADDPAAEVNQREDVARDDSVADAGDNSQQVFELTDDVRKILTPLFVAIKNAEVSRSTIEMLSDSLMTGQVVDSKKSTYQIASKSPDKFTIYLKEQSQRTRIYNDEEALVVALAPDAYFRIPESISNSTAMINLPVPMGPYPEPILALSLAGVDPAASLVSGMKSIEIVNRKKFRGKIPAVHLRGVQADAVNWELWLSDSDPPKPLRMLVNLTPMLLSSEELKLPRGYSHQIRFDFVSWRVTGEVDEALFSFTPAKDAKEYKSLADYNQMIAAKMAEHPLLGKAAPKFMAAMPDDQQFDSQDFQDKVLVIDFWASWHEPCAVILPAIKDVCDKFADKDVAFLALNIREDENIVKEFLKKNELEISVALDGDGSITESFAVETLPQTIVVGKSGKIESVHYGFPGEQELKQRLSDELKVLSIGGQIASVPQDANDQTPKSEPASKEDTE